MLALRGLRDATRDVDSVSRLDDDLAAAIARVAERHGLAPRWLNDSALPFLPATLREDHCDVLIDRTALRVLGASFDDVFIMKLCACRELPTPTTWKPCGRPAPSSHLRPPLRRSMPRTRISSLICSSPTRSQGSSDEIAFRLIPPCSGSSHWSSMQPNRDSERRRAGQPHRPSGNARPRGIERVHRHLGKNVVIRPR